MKRSERKREQEQRGQLSGIILRHRADIERRWLERVRTQFAGQEISPSELRNGMPTYLRRLAEGLREAATAEAGGVASWDNVVRDHAAQRVRLGFDIDQLVHEFIVLRQVILNIVKEEGSVRLDGRQSTRLADLVDGAIAAAVKSYVEFRDREARKREAEHIGFITHELRNPLTTAMLGTKQVLETTPLSPVQERALALVDRNQRRLAELIDGVLIVERDAHGLKPEPIVTTLGAILEQPLSAAKLAADAKSLHFEAHFDPAVGVRVDPKLATSAIDNVVQNALKYTDVGDVELDVEDNPSEVVVHVRDTGPGMSEEEVKTIFEPFRRASRYKPGTGLGLAIARRSLEVQGGMIRAESGPGKGCHFWLTLPKAPR